MLCPLKGKKGHWPASWSSSKQRSWKPTWISGLDLIEHLQTGSLFFSVLRKKIDLDCCQTPWTKINSSCTGNLTAKGKIAKLVEGKRILSWCLQLRKAFLSWIQKVLTVGNVDKWVFSELLEHWVSFVRQVYAPQFLSRHNKDLEWWTVKPPRRVTALRSRTDCIIALRQISVTAQFYLEDSRKIHLRGMRACRSKEKSTPCCGRKREKPCMHVWETESPLAPLFTS